MYLCTGQGTGLSLTSASASLYRAVVPVAESLGLLVLGMVTARGCWGGWVQGLRICLSVCLFCDAEEGIWGLNNVW